METNNNSSGKELKEFLLGAVLFAVGLFLFMHNVSVSSSYGLWMFGRMSISSGVVTIPFIVGAIWYFASKSFFAKFLMCLGVIFIILSVIMTIHIHFDRASLFFYMIMVLFMASGLGLMIKVLFKKR